MEHEQQVVYGRFVKDPTEQLPLVASPINASHRVSKVDLQGEYLWVYIDILDNEYGRELWEYMQENNPEIKANIEVLEYTPREDFRGLKVVDKFILQAVDLFAGPEFDTRIDPF